MATKTYSVSNVKQLIDLNGTSTNFDISFQVKSQNKEPFDILVVDQTTLDNTPKLEYKRIEAGEISGSLKNDKNVYQNYYLILKAEKPCQCDVTINKKEIPKQTQPVPQPTQSNPVQNSQPNPYSVNPPTKSNINWVKIVLIVAVVGVGGYFLYRMTRKKDNDNHNSGINERMNNRPTFNPVFNPSPSPSPSPNPSPNPVRMKNLSYSPSSSHGGGNKMLLQRLKSLNLS